MNLMNNPRRIMLGALILFLGMLPGAALQASDADLTGPQGGVARNSGSTPGAAAPSVYDQVMEVMASYDQRLPGSIGYEATLTRLTDVLTTAKLEVHRQTYATLVPHTQTCSLRLAEVEVPDVHPLAPNAIALPTTWGHIISGPMLYVGNGSMESMDGKTVRGCVAVMEFGSPNLDLVFSQGAKAVVLVGGEGVSQWQAETSFTALPASLPVVWVDREHARAAGLLTADGVKEGSLELISSWQPVEATNLWTKIPASQVQAIAEDEHPQVLVLSAEIDTFGAIPERSPQLRAAANAALLAQVAVNLSHGTLARPIYVLFLGSHYAAQDGCRNFYYPVGKVMAEAVGDSGLDAQENKLCLANMSKNQRQLAMVKDLSFVTESQNNEAIELYVMATQFLASTVDELNFQLLKDYQHRKHIESALAVAVKAGLKDNTLTLQSTLAAMDLLKSQIQVKKELLNRLRKQLANKQIVDAKDFERVTDFLTDKLQASIAFFSARLVDIRSAREIESAMRPRATLAETVAAHFSFDFADATRPWMFCPFGADAFARATDLSNSTFSRQLKAYRMAVESLPDAPGEAQLWTPDDSVSFRTDALCTPHQRSVPCAAPMTYGIPAFQLVTLGDSLDQDEMPVRGSWQLSTLAPRLTAVVQAIAGLDDLPQRCDLPLQPQDEKLMIQPSGKDISGMQTVDIARGSDVIEDTSKSAIVALDFLPTALSGAEPRYLLSGVNVPFAQVDATGHCFIPGIAELGAGVTESRTCVFGFDDFGSINRFVANGQAAGMRADLHFGFGGLFFTPFRPEDYTLGSISRPLFARADSAPKLSFGAGFSMSEVLYTDKDDGLKLLGDGIDMLGIGPDNKSGSGVSSDPRDLLSLDVNRQAAQDLIALNLQRLKLLREHNIINKPLEKLQADGQDELDNAKEASASGKTRAASAHILVANALGDRVHQPLRDNIQDLVQAVVILLLLSLPFSFAMERLLFGARSIYKQVSGFVGIFIITFLILYITHPAFSLAEAPIIIFLAFIILLLSVFVINVVLGKFKYELRAMQGLSSKAHGGQQETGTALAAIAIGISGMRNRPLKTALTAITVALLTFTILVFASFSSSMGVVPTYLGPAQGPHRIEFHTQSFLGMPPRLFDAVTSLYGSRFRVFRRGASFRDPTQEIYKDTVVNVAMNPSNLEMQSLDGILVLDPDELALPNALDPLFSPLSVPASPSERQSSSFPPIMLSKLVSEKLKLIIGQTVQIRGQKFKFVGAFDASRLKQLENIDGTRLVPPNFDATFKANGSHTENSGSLQATFKELDVNNFIFSSPELIAIATFPGMTKLGVQTNFMTLYPREGVNVDVNAPEIAEWLQGPVSSSSDTGSSRFFFTEKVEGSGIAEVLVPLLLGGLIIFSSLLGSIVDRQKEIFTYSALGLAPPDVATLFFAESAVFAVIGGMGGYLISQLVVKILSLLASHGICSVPDVNFSSFSSIVTILIVMATVMLSTIYPALMAGRSANPGVARKWRMPKPDGDTMHFTFPFTVSAESIAGILTFIREHFENHGDASLGAFSASNVNIFSRTRPSGEREMGITAEIALAPFDLGVFQRFTMTTKPSDIAGIDEVVVDLVRLNGSSGTWLRGNRAFIDDLREQFLRWRSLPIESVEHYHDLADGVVGATHG